MAELFTAPFWAQYGDLLWQGCLDTMIMVVISTVFSYLLGLPLGVLLVLTGDHGIRPCKPFHRILGWIVNIGRSIPFLILMIAIMDFTKFLVGTKIGIRGAIVPLVVSAAPFIARKTEKIADLPDGGTIAIPNDATNEARALYLLAEQGLIEIDPEAGLKATPNDITSNPKNLKFTELEAAMIPNTLDEFDLNVINSNFALQADLNPAEDALVSEDAESSMSRPTKYTQKNGW